MPDPNTLAAWLGPIFSVPFQSFSQLLNSTIKMKCFSTIQRLPITADSLLSEVEAGLSGATPHLCAAFISGPTLETESIHAISSQLKERWPDIEFFGCYAESLVCNHEEWEGVPAMTLWLASMPGVNIHAYSLQFEQTSEGHAFVGWPSLDAADWDHTRALITLADPFSFPMDALLERMSEDRPKIPIVGGLASGAEQPGENRLWLGDEQLRSGAVVIQLSGELHVETIVSQGCRPIGEPMVITEVERNAILRLGGRPSLEVLRDLFLTLPTSEQQLLQHGLLMGRFISEYGDRDKKMGDFLVRSVVGIEPDLNAIIVGDYFRPGQSVQFHLRDEASAHAELTQLLEGQERPSSPAGGLLFTCNGRGTRLFTTPHHDAAAFAGRYPGLPLAGFFAAGEVGPIGNASYVHGFTASAILFEALSPNSG